MKNQETVKPVTKKLTLTDLKEMEPGQIIAKGQSFIPEFWRNGDLKWVAVRGGAEDWALYYGLVHYDYDYIKRCGDKAFTETIIRKLVPCSDEAWKMYRF